MAVNGAKRVRLGDMLVTAELITEEQLEAALEAQRGTGLRLGKQLVQMGHVTEVQVTQTLSNQLSVPWVSIAHIEFSAALLQKVPGEIADRHSVMPIYVRSLRGQGDTLYVAMDDPTDEDALLAVSNASGLPVRPMVAPPSDIRAAIERRYFGAPDTLRPPAPAPINGRRPSRRPPPPNANADKRAAGTKAGERTPTGTRIKPPPPVEDKRPRRAPSEVPIEAYAVPSDPPPTKPASNAARTLTLLDGTTLALPSASKTSKAGSEIREVRHVMKSIIAAHKAGAAGGPPRWEEVIEVLLEIMRDRGVTVTRRQFAEAWLRRRGS